jgi:uncharacterized protein YabE (DUF348 family)
MKKNMFFGGVLALICILSFVRQLPVFANKVDSDTKLVHVFVDGNEKTIATSAKTVGEALASSGIELYEHDKTEPSVESEIIAADFNVQVFRARPISVIDGPNVYTITTAERTPRSIAEKAGFNPAPEDGFEYRNSESTVAERPGTRLYIKRSKQIIFELYGKSTSLRTQELTVADLLEEKNITLEPGDELNVPLATRIAEGMKISLAQVDRKITTVEEDIPFPEEKIQDANQPITYRQVKTPGVNGRKLVTYEVTIVNGREERKKSLKEVVVKEPVKQVAVVGAKLYSGSLAQWLQELRMCESGGNYQINTGNGFYGAYQFMASTWDRIAARVRPSLVGVLPHTASPADQDFMIIQNTKLSSGGLASQNPGCFRSRGLSAFPPE